MLSSEVMYASLRNSPSAADIRRWKTGTDSAVGAVRKPFGRRYALNARREMFNHECQKCQKKWTSNVLHPVKCNGCGQVNLKWSTLEFRIKSEVSHAKS